jgi:hypothetical protein
MDRSTVIADGASVEFPVGPEVGSSAVGISVGVAFSSSTEGFLVGGVAGSVDVGS